MHMRLHKITSRLDKLQKRLMKDAATSIATQIAQERKRLMDQWPLSGAQIAAIERAKVRHTLAVSGFAKRLARARGSRRAGGRKEDASSRSTLAVASSGSRGPA